MRLGWIALGILTIGAIGIVGFATMPQQGTATATPQQNSTPESSLIAIATAFSHKDFPGIAAFVVGGNPKADFSPILGMVGSQAWPTIKVSLVKPTITGDTAKVAYHIEVGVPGAPPQSIDEASDMKLVGGVWQIVPEDPTKPSPRHSGMMSLAYAIIHPTGPSGPGGSASSARSTMCISNAKQLALGCIMFAGDNDNVFKFPANSVHKSLAPYLKNERLWLCPADTTAGPSYTFNSNLVGISMDKIDKPTETVMVYEGKAGKLEFRHDGRAAVAFADGHVRLIDATAAKAVIWTAKAPK